MFNQHIRNKHSQIEAPGDIVEPVFTLLRFSGLFPYERISICLVIVEAAKKKKAKINSVSTPTLEIVSGNNTDGNMSLSGWSSSIVNEGVLNICLADQRADGAVWT